MRMNTNDQQHVLDRMATTVEEASAPLQRIEHALAGPVTFFVLPVFALANAGVTIHGGLLEELDLPDRARASSRGSSSASSSGSRLATWLAVKLRLADLPSRVGWGQIAGVALLGGIGFTMALVHQRAGVRDRRRRRDRQGRRPLGVGDRGYRRLARAA